MSTLKEFLNKECPDGVEYVPLWSVTIWDKKFNSVDKDKQKTIIKYKYYLADELKQLVVENGNVKILTTNISNLFTLEKLVSNSLSYGEIVCIPWGGNPIVQYYKGKFITSDNRIATSIDVNKLDNKFLYYVLINKLDLISSFYRGAGIKHPDMSKVLDIIIPLPPIEVQKEIVRILDEFTEKTTKLQELLHRETILRKKQYEYYRDKLLTFAEGTQPCGDEVEWKSICDFSNIIAGGDVPKNNFSKEKTTKYNIPIISNGIGANALYGYTNIIKIDKPSISLSARGTIGHCIYHEKPFYPIVRLICITPNNDCNAKFLKYYFETIKFHIPKTGIPQLTIPMVKDIKIPLPPLEEQERIVNILDKFDALCNDITKGLPAEIEMRKKQYEYYRDKLLTFKEKKK